MMRIHKTHVSRAIVGAVVFSVLLEEFNVLGSLSGAAVGLLFAFIGKPFDFNTDSCFNGRRLIRYGALLLRDMARATGRQIRLVLRPEPIQPVIVHIKPQADEADRVLTANSITLTPGTVTLEESERDYTVLCAAGPKSQEAKEAIAVDFEKRLIQRRNK